ncbi:cyclase family protein [Erwinia sp. 198]|uniref:cyclase family protein n=1 Tax=Erwinia sp. 198 TaxID=2022746 RepID=UPI00131565F6|nr:cyclase family protein [Erwinia sp. 198]
MRYAYSTPVHFIPDGKGIDKVDIRQLTGRNCCLDMTHLPQNSAITLATIAHREARDGEIAAKDIVLFRTGHDKSGVAVPIVPRL